MSKIGKPPKPAVKPKPTGLKPSAQQQQPFVAEAKTEAKKFWGAVGVSTDKKAQEIGKKVTAAKIETIKDLKEMAQSASAKMDQVEAALGDVGDSIGSMFSNWISDVSHRAKVAVGTGALVADAVAETFDAHAQALGQAGEELHKSGAKVLDGVDKRLVATGNAIENTVSQVEQNIKKQLDDGAAELAQAGQQVKDSTLKIANRVGEGLEVTGKVIESTVNQVEREIEQRTQKAADALAEVAQSQPVQVIVGTVALGVDSIEGAAQALSKNAEKQSAQMHEEVFEPMAKEAAKLKQSVAASLLRLKGKVTEAKEEIKSHVAGATRLVEQQKAEVRKTVDGFKNSIEKNTHAIASDFSAVLDQATADLTAFEKRAAQRGQRVFQGPDRVSLNNQVVYTRTLIDHLNNTGQK